MNSSRLTLALLITCGCQPAAKLDDGDASSETSSGATESTTETSESGDGSSDSDSVPFVPENDWYPPSCDPWLQDCPVGEKCVAYASGGSNWDANKCVPLMGDQHAGEACVYAGSVEAWDDCDALSACWDFQDVDGELVGTCVPFCTGTPDAPECPRGSACLTSSAGVLILCIEHCDPILQDCELGSCFWTGDDFECVSATENLPTGSPCGFVNDCTPGNICIGAEQLPSCDGVACCTAYCSLRQADLDCAAQPGTACAPFFVRGMAPVGYEDVGYCVVP